MTLHRQEVVICRVLTRVRNFEKKKRRKINQNFLQKNFSKFVEEADLQIFDMEKLKQNTLNTKNAIDFIEKNIPPEGLIETSRTIKELKKVTMFDCWTVSRAVNFLARERIRKRKNENVISIPLPYPENKAEPKKIGSK